MQCPNCNHEAPQADYGDALQCPSCGAFYAKALAAKQRRAAQESEPVQAGTAEPLPAAPAPVKTKSSSFKLAANQVEVATHGLNGAHPVVVVDVQMRFWSMIVFMVKWSLAAIPALIILIFIGAATVALMTGWMAASVQTSSIGNAVPDRVSEKVTPKERVKPIVATLADKGFFAAVDGHVQDELAFSLYFKNNTGRAISDFDGSVLFTDPLGNKILDAKIVSDALLPADGTIKRGYSVRFNQFMRDHVQFREQDTSKIKVEFKPRRVIYIDGDVEDF